MRLSVLALLLALPAAAQPARVFVGATGGALRYDALTAPYAEAEVGVDLPELHATGTRVSASLYGGVWGGEAQACSECVSFDRRGTVAGVRVALRPGRLPIRLLAGLSRYGVRDDLPPPLYGPTPVMPTVLPDWSAHSVSWGAEYGLAAAVPLWRGLSLAAQGSWRLPLNDRYRTTWTLAGGVTLRP